MLDFVYPSILPSKSPYFSLLNSFNINIPNSLDLKSVIPSNFLTKCGNCQVIQTNHTVFPYGEAYCLLCGYRVDLSKLPKNHPVFMKESRNSLLFSREINNMEILIPETTVYIFALIDTSASMSLTYAKKKTKKPDYISRLEIAVSALKSGLRKLSQKAQRLSYKLCLITFDSEISVFGDLKNNQILRSSNLKSFDFDKSLEWIKGGKASNLLNADLKESLEELEKSPIFNKDLISLLGEKTNLGCAISTALGIIEDLKISFSHILVFTDNYSNEGFFQLSYIEEFKTSNIEVYQACKDPILEEVKKINRKVQELNTSIDFFGFEEKIGIEFLSKMTGSFSQVFKAHILEEFEISPKEKEKILDLAEFQNSVDHSLMKFEYLIGFQAENSLFLSPNVQLIDRNPKTLNSHNITPGKDLSIIKENIGTIWAENQLNFSFQFLENDQDPQVLIHSELKFAYLERNLGFLEKIRIQPLILVSEKLISLCDESEFSPEKIDVLALKTGFYGQKLIFDEKEIENMMVLLYEIQSKEIIEDFRKDLDFAGMEKISKNIEKYRESARENRSLREKMKKMKNEQKEEKTNILNKIKKMNVLTIKHRIISPLEPDPYKCNKESDEENEETIKLLRKFENVNFNEKHEFFG